VKRRSEPDFVCPNCGADVPGGATSCPECGSDENTGWSEDTYLDGVTLPGEDDEDVHPGDRKTAGGILGPGKWLWVVVAGVVLAVAAAFRLASLAR
jgi:hypothetical protein